MSAKARKKFMQDLQSAVEASGNYSYADRVSPSNAAHIRVEITKIGATGQGAKTWMDLDEGRAYSVWASVCGIYKTLFGNDHAKWPKGLSLVKEKKIEREMANAAEEVAAPVAAAPRPSRMDIVEILKTHEPRGSFADFERALFGDAAEEIAPVASQPARPIIGISMSDEAFTGRPAGSGRERTIVVRGPKPKTQGAGPRWRVVRVGARRIGERPIEYRM